MIGNRYWSNGITLVPYEGGDWSVSLVFVDDGVADRRSTGGTLCVRYNLQRKELEACIVSLKADAERLGIVWERPTVYVLGDGEWDSDTRGNAIEYPSDWRSLAAILAGHLGWEPAYEKAAS